MSTGNDYPGSTDSMNPRDRTTRGNEYEGTLIAVEGLDGSGKTTVVDAIEKWAEENDADVVVTKEPTDMWTGDTVYRALGDEDTPPVADFSMFVADRVKHVEQRVKPALERGAIVVTDRYAGSTRAYQTHRIADQTGMSYDEAREWMETVFEPWHVEPDITIYLNITVDEAMERCDVGDKYEKRENLERVKDAYESMYNICDPSVRYVDAMAPKSYVRHKCLGVVKTVAHGRDIHVHGGDKTYKDAAEEFTE